MYVQCHGNLIVKPVLTSAVRITSFLIGHDSREQKLECGMLFMFELVSDVQGEKNQRGNCFWNVI